MSDTAPLPWLSSGNERHCYVPAGAWGWLGRWRDGDGSHVLYSWSPGPLKRGGKTGTVD